MPLNGSNAIDQITAGVTAAEKFVSTDKDNEVHGVKIDPTHGVVQSQELLFTEADGSAAGVYTGTVELPAGATLIDIIVHQVALWTAATDASLIVGDTVDPDGFYTATSLKATDLLADESMSFDKQGAQGGAFLTVGTSTHISDRRKATAALNKVVAEVTTTGAVGTAGITRILVVYAIAPETEVSATFVAS